MKSPRPLTIVTVTKIFTKDIEYQNESLSLSRMNENAARSQVKTSSFPRNNVQTSSTGRTESPIAGQRFDRTEQQALGAPLPCICQHHLDIKLHQFGVARTSIDGDKSMQKVLHRTTNSPRSGGREVGPALALVNPLQVAR